MIVRPGRLIRAQSGRLSGCSADAERASSQPGGRASMSEDPGRHGGRARTRREHLARPGDRARASYNGSRIVEL
eukprot:1185678-Rhodomonas_salina.1